MLRMGEELPVLWWVCVGVVAAAQSGVHGGQGMVEGVACSIHEREPRGGR